MRGLLDRVVEQCLAAGLASADPVVVDGTHDPRRTPTSSAA